MEQEERADGRDYFIMQAQKFTEEKNSTSEEFLIRSARPEDAEDLAWAILAATRSHLPCGWLDIALRQPTEGCLDYLRRLTLTQARSWWHYSRFLVSETNGKFASALCAFRAGDAYPQSAAAMVEVADALGWSGAKQKAMRDQSAFVFSCMMETDDDFWVLENIATLPEYCRRGMAQSLIRYALLIGQSKGLRQAQITFLSGNEAAERTYIKAGFKFADEKFHPDFESAIGSRGLRRFTRDL